MLGRGLLLCHQKANNSNSSSSNDSGGRFSICGTHSINCSLSSLTFVLYNGTYSTYILLLLVHDNDDNDDDDNDDDAVILLLLL